MLDRNYEQPEYHEEAEHDPVIYSVAPSRRPTFSGASRERDPSTRNKIVDLLICKDSNFRHIDYRKLWTVRNSVRKTTSGLSDVENFIQQTNISTLNHILIHTGVNDIDELTGIQVFNKIAHVIHQVKSKYPGVKIIISEITPRKDELDCEVLACNKMLNAYAATQDHVYVADHSNLRDENFTYHRNIKHIKENKIANFAANLK